MTDSYLDREGIRERFEATTLDLDRWRRRNKYYYRDLESLHKFAIPADSDVLEIGCGTGHLLAALSPRNGVGIDFSKRAIELASDRYPHLDFHCLDAEQLSLDRIQYIPALQRKFDYIILSNSVGHLNDIQGVLRHLHQFCHRRTRLIIDCHSFLWEPILKVAETLGQRGPQPPQNWLSLSDLTNLLTITGYKPIETGRRLLLPKNLPIVSNFVNRYLAPLPILNNLCLTNYIIARSQLSPQIEETPKPSVSVIIPARNEAGNIANAIARMPKLGDRTEVIFIEGNSSDNTWETIQNVVANYSGELQLSAYQQTGKGKGDAVRLGFDRATGDILIILDADLTVPPEELGNFIQPMVDDRGEFINGSRLVYPYSHQAMPWLNTLANKFFAIVFSFLLDRPIKDTLCGTKVLWREDYRRIAANRKYFGDFDPFGDFDLLFGAAKLNLEIVEVPVRYQPRTYGSSNIAHFREGLVLLKMCLYAAQKIKFIR
jgi:SAM-dependent methyltransferase